MISDNTDLLNCSYVGQKSDRDFTGPKLSFIWDIFISSEKSQGVLFIDMPEAVCMILSFDTLS